MPEDQHHVISIDDVQLHNVARDFRSCICKVAKAFEQPHLVMILSRGTRLRTRQDLALSCFETAKTHKAPGQVKFLVLHAGCSSPSIEAGWWLTLRIRSTSMDSRTWPRKTTR